MEESIDNKDLAVIGKIIKTVGLKGEVVVEPMTYDPNRFFDLKKVCIKDSEGTRLVTIKSVRFHKKSIAICFNGCHSQEDVAPLIGSLIMINKKESPPLPEGTYYYYQLENLDVFDEQGQFLGRITEIMKAGGADVYTVKNNDGRELLIPSIKDSILNIDLEQKKMIVKVLEMY